MLKIAFPTPRKDEKRQKSFIARERNAENAENNVSLASDERKTQKTSCRLWFFFENCQKQRFACKRQAENAENRSSLVSETQKL